MAIIKTTGLGTLKDSLLFDSTSNGIHLGVTSATASNLLDDYEEGTWTPTLDSTGSVTVDSYSQRYGKYFKIGNQVTIICGIRYTLTGTPSGDPKITGLPFSPPSTNYYTGVALGLTTGIKADSNQTSADGLKLSPTVRSSSDIRFYYSAFSSTTSNAWISFTATYETT